MIDQPAAVRRFDVIIAGAGPTGMAMALALARMLGDDVAIARVDPAPPQPAAPPAANAGDPRAWALSAASVRFLEALGVWAATRPAAQPVTAIDITDSSLEAGQLILKFSDSRDISPGGCDIFRGEGICCDFLIVFFGSADITYAQGIVRPIIIDL